MPGSPSSRQIKAIFPCFVKIEEIVNSYEQDTSFTFYPARRRAKLWYWSELKNEMSKWATEYLTKNFTYLEGQDTEQLKNAHVRVLEKMTPQQKRNLFAGGQILGSHKSVNYMNYFGIIDPSKFPTTLWYKGRRGLFGGGPINPKPGEESLSGCWSGCFNKFFG
ncbi:MAG: hypothetical protein JSR33_05845 [Proteobacteria bacterium]|nr:hypothetical protein [Pseudomonadota bacterium]